MKFIKCEIDEKTSNVIIRDTTEVEKDFDAVVEEVRSGDKFSCGYLFYPGDRPGLGSPTDKYVTRKDYLQAPGCYGVCIYKTWNGSVVFE